MTDDDTLAGRTRPGSDAPRPRPDDDTLGGAADPDTLADPDLPRGPRFTILRRLGEGGMGIVYEAFDAERDERVALKTMRYFDPSALFRFKLEFRGLADLVHPNLVALHELMSVDDRWFFTMELVQGVDLLRWVRPDGEALDTGRLRGVARQLVAGLQALHRAGKLHRDIKPSNVLVTAEGRLVLLDFGLVTDVDPRALMADDAVVGTAAYMAPEQAAHGQLSEASDYYAMGALLYEALTRQVPFQGELRAALANTASFAPPDLRGADDGDDTLAARPDVSVDPDEPASLHPTTAVGDAGPPRDPRTARPADPRPALAASEQLQTGRMSPLMLMLAKQTRDPVPPSRLADDVPPDLERLCQDLLARDPAARPDGDEILRRLAGAPTAVTITVVPELALVGRTSHLARLADALAACRAGAPVSVYVHGVSGMGKSALIHHFLERLQARGDALVLHGRCYERESVPYKALDSVVDALSQHLRRQDPAEAAALLPRETWALATLFPVLRRVDAVEASLAAGDRSARSHTLHDPASSGAGAALQAPGETHEPHEVRALAVQALRALLGRLAAASQVVLAIDDMQWGDGDSARVLVELLAAPGAPPVLLLGSYRSDERDASPLLRELRPPDEARRAGDTREIEVGPLAEPDALDLARALLGEAHADAAQVVARESEGNPFFIAEMARHRRESAASSTSPATDAASPTAAAVSLVQVVQTRVAALPPDERDLLEVIAVAGRPIAQGVVFRAGDLTRRGRAALAALRAAHLVRTRGAHSDDTVEAYHDRIREIVVAHLPADRLADRHRGLALTLEADAADPDALAVHFRGAGDLPRAARYAEAAAERAFATLAFGRAAELFRLTLELHPALSAEARRNLLRRLAAALANAGRSVESAEVYLRAADGAPPVLALELRRAAAEKFLVSGHVDRGQDLLRDVLADVDLALPNTPLRALLSLLWHRLRIQIRGLKFAERAADDIPLETLTRIDTCWAAALGLAMVDNVRGADFQARHLLLALEAGEPYRVARALAMEVGYCSSAGSPAHRRSEKLRTEALALAAHVGHPHALGVATMTAGLTYYFEGGWRRGFELFERSEQILRRQCTGVRAEIVNATLYSLRCQVYLGRLKDANGRLPGLISEAQERTDLYASTYFRLRYAYLADLAADDPAVAIANVEHALASWSHRGYHVQHYLELFARGEVELYTGDGDAWAHIAAWLVPIKRSHLLRIQHFRVESEHLRGRAALAAAVTGPPALRGKRLAETTREADALRNEGVPWAVALSDQLLGGVHCLRGERARALAAYRSAAELFDRADMRLYAMASRRRLGELLADSEGAELCARADAFMRDEGIANQARWTTMYCGYPLHRPEAVDAR